MRGRQLYAWPFKNSTGRLSASLIEGALTHLTHADVGETPLHA